MKERRVRIPRPPPKDPRPRETVTKPYRPTLPAVVCRCGAFYLDDDEGRDAHDVVFGHQPIKPVAP